MSTFEKSLNKMWSDKMEPMENLRIKKEWALILPAHSNDIQIYDKFLYHYANCLNCENETQMLRNKVKKKRINQFSNSTQ